MFLKFLSMIFTKPRKERILLSKKTHSFLRTRGVPGTHDTNFIFKLFKRVKSKRFRALKFPKFNKAIDDRYKKAWYLIKKRPDVIIFEGWCVGAKAETILYINQ